MSGVRRDNAAWAGGSASGDGTVTDRSTAASRTRGRAEIWGVLNVTPDSFSDGGAHLDPAAAVARARVMLAEGADVIDVGGASSRPPGAAYGAGAAPVDPAEELRRTREVVRVIARDLGARVSIDTTRGAVAREALVAGARIVNDVSMGADPDLLAAAAEHGADLVLMHNRGDGRVPARPGASDVVTVVIAELSDAVERAVRAGVERERIWIDPGIGFAKTESESASLLGGLERITDGPYRVLVGASRKSFLGALAPEPDGTRPAAGERLAGSLAAVTVAVLRGAAAVRVHDVRASRQAALVAAALRAPRLGGLGAPLRSTGAPGAGPLAQGGHG